MTCNEILEHVLKLEQKYQACPSPENLKKYEDAIEEAERRQAQVLRYYREMSCEQILELSKKPNTDRHFLFMEIIKRMNRNEIPKHLMSDLMDAYHK